MKKIILGLSLFVGLGLSAQEEVTVTSIEIDEIVEDSGAKTQAGDLLIRLRATGIIPNVSSSIGVIGGEAEVDNAFIPELDFTYFITNRFAAELILGTSQHDVNTKGSDISPIVASATNVDIDLGDVRLLPPTLSFQYHHPVLKGKIKPYVGVGINYTFFYDADQGPVVADIDYDNAFGYAFQGGVDIFGSDKYFINLDVKKMFLNTDVTVNASNLDPNNALGLQQTLSNIKADVDLDPWIVSFGIGRKF
ncbi:outer membrane protein [Flavobacteriaceae bacterium UJ101]|nr:outer membrane protein [Flavobacteriaceae bacterium UJ101]